jgi:hypothetical protein
VVFRSKVDAWLVLVAVFVPVIALAFVAYRTRLDPKAMPVVLIVALAAGAAALIFTKTNYTIDGDVLIIRSGFFRWRVPIRDIESVTPTHNPSSSPALSLDRLEIRYGPKTILVSPDDKAGFIRALTRINPNIRL